MVRLLALALLVGGVVPASAAEPVRMRNRLSAGVLVHAGAGGANLEAVLSDRLRLDIRRGPVAAQVRFDGRLGVSFTSGPRLSRTRITALGVELRHERFWLEAGRFRVVGGGWRLADGVQGMAILGQGVEVGGWLGAVPDPWTTAPAPRFGGGPAVRWVHEVAQVGATVELAGTAAGLDRAAVVLDGRVEVSTGFEVSARADLQHGGPSAPLVPADLGVVVTGDPLPDLRIRGRYDAWSGLAYLQGWDRDPGIGRFAARFSGTVPVAEVPQGAPDLSMAHQLAGSVRWTPTVGALRLRVAPDARYRHHEHTARRHVRARLRLGLGGLGNDRLELAADGGATLWRQAWRAEFGFGARITPDRGRWLSLDASVRTVITPGPTPKFAGYADAFVDLMTPAGVSLAAGYRFSSEAGLDRWDGGHTGLLRVTWRLSTPRRKP